MKRLAERREACSMFCCFRKGVLSVLRSREGGAGDTEERKEEAKCQRSLAGGGGGFPLEGRVTRGKK